MLLIALPALACAMPVCAEDAAATPAAQAMPCHEEGGRDSEKERIAPVKLLKDCMGQDLMAAPNAADIQPAAFNDTASPALPVQAGPLMSVPAGQRHLPRAPPGRKTAPALFQSSLILTTGRARL